MLSCEEKLAFNAASTDRTSTVKVGAGDSTSVAEKSSVCAVQDCESVLCFWSVGAAAGNTLVVQAQNAVSITDEEAGNT